jgi:hypothetical protein
VDAGKEHRLNAVTGLAIPAGVARGHEAVSARPCLDQADGLGTQAWSPGSGPATPRTPARVRSGVDGQWDRSPQGRSREERRKTSGRSQIEWRKTAARWVRKAACKRRLAVARTVRGKPVRKGCLVTLSNRTPTGFPSLRINGIGLNYAPFQTAS